MAKTNATVYRGWSRHQPANTPFSGGGERTQLPTPCMCEGLAAWILSPFSPSPRTQACPQTLAASDALMRGCRHLDSGTDIGGPAEPGPCGCPCPPDPTPLQTGDGCALRAAPFGPGSAMTMILAGTMELQLERGRLTLLLDSGDKDRDRRGE